MYTSRKKKTSLPEPLSASDPAVSILIVDRDPGTLDFASNALAQPGLEIFTAASSEEGLEVAARVHPSILLIDWDARDASSPTLFDEFTSRHPGMDIVAMSSLDSAGAVVSAVQHGARDFLVKPLSLAATRACIARLTSGARAARRAQALENELRINSKLDMVIGRSTRMWDVISHVRQVAPHYRTLLITGETGTGKDLIARVAHQYSPASAGRYVVLNCSSIVESLFESEMFGHSKGAFTGARHEKPGIFEYADGGTILLDEIGDMPLATQAKLLRVLQNGEVQRVGALESRRVNVRVIGATNRNLREAVAQKRFREDLFYRLSMVEIEVPRLADRLDDLPFLSRFFIARFAAQWNKEIVGMTQRAELLLARHRWPGNVRELENVLGRAVIMANNSGLIDVQDLPPYLRGAPSLDAPPPAEIRGSVAVHPPAPIQPAHPLDALREQECKLLRRALESTAGNQCRAARLLHIGRDALRYKMKKHHLSFTYEPHFAPRENAQAVAAGVH